MRFQDKKISSKYSWKITSSTYPVKKSHRQNNYLNKTSQKKGISSHTLIFLGIFLQFFRETGGTSPFFKWNEWKYPKEVRSSCCKGGRLFLSTTQLSSCFCDDDWTIDWLMTRPRALLIYTICRPAFRSLFVPENLPAMCSLVSAPFCTTSEGICRVFYNLFGF